MAGRRSVSMRKCQSWLAPNSDRKGMSPRDVAAARLRLKFFLVDTYLVRLVERLVAEDGRVSLTIIQLLKKSGGLADGLFEVGACREIGEARVCIGQVIAPERFERVPHKGVILTQ